MVAGIGHYLLPIFAAVVGREDRSARTYDNRKIFIYNISRRKRSVGRRKLLLPMKAAIGRAHYRAVGTDGDARFLIFCKMDRVKWVALRQRILPRPAERASRLCECEGCGK